MQHLKAASTVPVIEYESFPHIVEAVVDVAPYELLLTFRAVSRKFRQHVDIVLAEQLVMHVTPPPWPTLTVLCAADRDRNGRWLEAAHPAFRSPYSLTAHVSWSPEQERLLGAVRKLHISIDGGCMHASAIEMPIEMQLFERLPSFIGCYHFRRLDTLRFTKDNGDMALRTRSAPPTTIPPVDDHAGPKRAGKLVISLVGRPIPYIGRDPFRRFAFVPHEELVLFFNSPFDCAVRDSQVAFPNPAKLFETLAIFIRIYRHTKRITLVGLTQFPPSDLEVYATIADIDPHDAYSVLVFNLLCQVNMEEGDGTFVYGARPDPPLGLGEDFQAISILSWDEYRALVGEEQFDLETAGMSKRSRSQTCDRDDGRVARATQSFWGLAS